MTYFVLLITLMSATGIGYWPPSGERGILNFITTTGLGYISLLLQAFFICLHSPKLPNPASKLGYIPFVLLCGWALTSAAHSGSTQAIFSVIKLSIFLYFLITAFSKRPDEAARALQHFIFFFAFLNIFMVALIPNLGIETSFEGRAGTWRGALPFKTQLGVTAASFFALLFFTSRSQNKTCRTLERTALILLLLLLIGSASRMAWFSLSFALLLYGQAKILHGVPKIYKLPALIFSLAGTLLLFPIAAGILLDALAASGRDLTFSGRTVIWGYFIDVALKKPIFGWGMGIVVRTEWILDGARALMGGFTEFSTAHSAAIEWLLHAGVPGGIFFLSILVSSATIGMKNAWKNRTREGMRNLALAIVAGSSCLFTSSAGYTNVIWFFLIFIPMSFSRQTSPLKPTPSHIVKD
jgi:O-antigen ligase